MKKIEMIVVEDDEDEQFFLAQGFGESGLFDLLAILRNGDQLFEWFNEEGQRLPELILSDLNMPGMNGRQIIREMKASQRYAHIPVVIMSTSTITQVISSCISDGAAAYMVKPDIFVDYTGFARDLYNLVLEKKILN